MHDNSSMKESYDYEYYIYIKPIKLYTHLLYMY